MDRCLYYGEYEHWETRTLKRIIRPGWTVLDAGANMGYYTLLLARLVGPTGRVDAIEPAAATFAALKRNLKLNTMPQVRLHRLALADRVGESQLRHGAHSGIAHLADVAVDTDEPVQVLTLDEFVAREELARLDFVKIDIEGAEGRFLKGGESTIKRWRPTLLIEFNPPALERAGTNPSLVLAALREAGYGLTQPTWHGLRPVRSEQRTVCNLLAIPRMRRVPSRAWNNPGDGAIS
jgi:FkbM family methyltransferase